MKHDGRGVIRIEDKTDHGGFVTRASSQTTVLGRKAALAGDTTSCPKCGGEFAILAGQTGARHSGTIYAYDGDLTACGARLISSIP